MEGLITDPDRLLELEQGYKQEQLDALTWQPMTKAPISTGSGVIGYSWRVENEFQPAYTYPEQFHDKEKMLHVQMQKANYMRYRCIGRIPGVWAEFKGMIPTMFGAKLELMADAASMEGLWYRHCEDDLKAIVDRGLPPLAAGLFPTIKEFTEYFRDHLPDGFYLGIPGIGEAFSWAVDILGPRIYTEVYDRPELVHQLLDLITETMIKTDAALYKIAGYERLDETWYLGGFVPGIVTEGDSVVGLSPQTIREFVVPYVKKLAKGLDAKCFFHYCPNPRDTRDSYTRHPVEPIISVEEVVGLNSQPLGYWVYQDYYQKLNQNRVGIHGYKPLPDNHTDPEFVRWVEDMCAETYGRSGINLTLRKVMSFEETRKLKEIWDAL